VKEAVVSHHLPPMGCLMLLCALTAPGAATAEASGIGVHLGVHGAKHSASGCGGTAGEGTAIKSPK